MSTEELTAVKRKRGGVEARFTLFKTYLTNLKKTQVEIPNLEINRNVYIELESRLERANQLLYEFEQIQNELEEMVGLDKLPEQLDERRAFENTFFETIAEAKGAAVKARSKDFQRETFQKSKAFVSTGMKKLIRIMALWLRYLSNCKIPKTRLFERCTGILTPVELSYAEKRLAYISQKEAFVNELLTLKQGKLITKGSLSSLNPFLDKDGIIRVGGRLQLSEFSYEKMHPIVISAKHPFSKLLFRYEHENLCHA
ncbi:hypothetical protein NQ314_012851, partial [Rhamnusium bicolor]